VKPRLCHELRLRQNRRAAAQAKDHRQANSGARSQMRETRPAAREEHGATPIKAPDLPQANEKWTLRPGIGYSARRASDTSRLTALSSFPRHFSTQDIRDLFLAVPAALHLRLGKRAQLRALALHKLPEIPLHRGLHHFKILILHV